MGKVALLVPNNLWVSPYVFIYTRLLDSINVEYELISWNREGRDEIGIQYQGYERNRNVLLVLISYLRFSWFLKETIKERGYERLVVFSSQLGLFLSSFLKKHYKGRYILDYRDLSIEQKPFWRTRFKTVLNFSYATVISSPGFKRYLPIGYKYVISHNFNVDIVKKVIFDKQQIFEGDKIRVLTIGAIRLDRNVEVMDALGNVSGVQLSFIGKGMSAEYLKKYAKSKEYNNIVFKGFYNKEEESTIYKQHTVVNIVYPRIPSHISALSNRFYNSLIYKRPMIVTSSTVQGDYAQQYGVGLVIDHCDNLKDKLMAYINNLDFEKYAQQCNQLLVTFLEENKVFENMVRTFIDNN